MEIFLFLAVVLLLFWVGRMNRRLHRLEKWISGTAPARLSSQAVQKAPLTVPLAPAVEPPKVLAAQPKTAEQQAELTTAWATKIGVIALVIGVGFFLKYAIDQGWISVWTRIVMGFATGGLLIVLGELWKDKYRKYALSLAGGGIAMLYFSVFAAYQFYSLFSQTVGGFLVVLITALAAWLAIRHKSLELGVLAVVGAFLSPFILYSHRDQQIALFVYLSVVNVGIVFTMARRFWMELLYVGFLGTVLDFSIWAFSFSNTDNTKESVFFLLLTYFLYLVIGNLTFREGLRKQNTAASVDHLTALNILQGIFMTSALFVLLYPDFRVALPYVWIFQSILNFVAYGLVSPLKNSKLNYSLSFFGFLPIVFTAFLEFDGKGLAAALLLTAMLAVVSGLYLKRRELRVFGFCVLLISLGTALFSGYGVENPAFLFNARFGLLVAEVLAFAAVYALYRRADLSESEQSLDRASGIIAILLLGFAVSSEILSYFGNRPAHIRQMVLSLWWMFYALANIGWGAVRKDNDLARVSRLFGFVLLILSLVSALYMPYKFDNYTFLFNPKFILMFIEVVAFAAAARLFALVEENKDEKSLAYFSSIVAAMLLWFAVSWEIVAATRDAATVNGRNLFLSLWWIIYATVLIALGAMRKSVALRQCATAIFVLAILKVFLYDVQSLDIGYRIVSFIVLGVILLSVSYGYHRNKARIAEFLSLAQNNGQRKAPLDKLV